MNSKWLRHASRGHGASSFMTTTVSRRGAKTRAPNVSTVRFSASVPTTTYVFASAAPRVASCVARLSVVAPKRRHRCGLEVALRFSPCTT